MVVGTPARAAVLRMSSRNTPGKPAAFLARCHCLVNVESETGLPPRQYQTPNGPALSEYVFHRVDFLSHFCRQSGGRFYSPPPPQRCRVDCGEVGKPACIIVLYAALALLTIPVFPHFLSANEFSRWIVDAAIVDDHTLEVTHINSLFGNRIKDLSRVGGRLYSNKAPGVSLVGLPAYALARMFTGPPRPETMRITLTVTRWLASTLPMILLGWLMLRAARRFGVTDESQRWMIVVLLFATPLFAYGMLLFSHALTAFALFGSWFFSFMDRRPMLAGALMGVAVLAEYTSAVVAILFLICAAIWRRRDLLRLIAGGLPFLAILLLYNQLAFGSPFNVSYAFSEYDKYRALARSGVFGIHLPSVSTLAKLLFDPSRGVVVLSPVVLCVFGATCARRRIDAPAFWSLILAPLLLLFTFAGYPYWHGGWGVGARYLTPALPFVVFLMSFAEISFGAAVLLGMSVAAIVTLSLVFPFVPPNAFPFPWGSLAWPILRDGLVAPNLFHLVARPAAIAAPFIVVIAAVLIGVPRRFWIGVVAGAITTIAFGILYANSTPELLMARAYFEEVYFEERGALVRALPKGMIVRPQIERNLRGELESPPTAWPF